MILTNSFLISAETSSLLAEIQGNKIVLLGEKLKLNLKFSNKIIGKKVTVQWIDSKNRVCEELTKNIAEESSRMSFKFMLSKPIGYHHQITVKIDNILQNTKHDFIVKYPYKKWIDYKACVWAHYDQAYGSLLREAGINGSISGKENVTYNDFDFYMDNICYEVFAYYHKRRGEHIAIKKLWEQKPNRRVIQHRRPSLTDEGSYEKVRTRLWHTIEKSKDFRPLFYNIADEIGITDQSSVSDLDWEYSSRTAWRYWLENKYKSLDKLNNQWGTNHDTWRSVRAFFPSTHHLYDQLWLNHLLPAQFKNIKKLNKEFNVGVQSFEEFILAYRKIRTDDASLSAEGLTKKFKNISSFNKVFSSNFKEFKSASQFIKQWESWVDKQDSINTKNWNLSWWCDWREYMDDYMANGLGRARKIGQEKDPEGIFGITGTHHPGVFSGHNYAKLMKNLDYIMPYDIGQSFELMRGLNPNYLFMNPTWQKGNKLKRDIWYHFFHNCRGLLSWDNHETKNKLIDRKNFKLTQRGKDGAETLKEITNGLDQIIFQSKRVNNGIAIYQSQASARINWIHQFINLGRHWIKRQSWHEYKQDGRSTLRTSWIKIIEDLHLQFLFISPEQLLNNRLKKEEIKLLILPEIWAMNKNEADTIKLFVKNGGVVIADHFTGLYDFQGKRREKGILDEAFGIDQTLVMGDPRHGKHKETTSDLKTNKALKILADQFHFKELNTRPKGFNPVKLYSANALYYAGSKNNVGLVSNNYGKGTFIFLNIDLSHYSRTRMVKDKKDQRENLLKLIAFFIPNKLKSEVSIRNTKSNKRQQGTEVVFYEVNNNEKIMAVWRNFQVTKDGLGGENYFDNSIFEKTENITIEWESEYHIKNQRTGEYLGFKNSLKLKLDPWIPLILSLSKNKFEEFSILKTNSVAKLGQVKKIEIQAKSDNLHVYNITVSNPKGKRIYYYSKDISSRFENIIFEIPFALNDLQGQWNVEIVDVFTKFKKTLKVNLGK